MTRRRTWWVAILLLVPTAFGILYFGTPEPSKIGPSTVAMAPDTIALFEEPPLAGLIDTTPSLQEAKGWPFQPLPRVAKKDRPVPPPVDTVVVPVDSIFQPTPPRRHACMPCTPPSQPLPLWVVPPLAAAVLVTHAEVRTTVPEPSTLGLVAIGLVLLAVRRTRQ